MRQQFKASNISEIRNLLNVALACLESGEMDRMAWRIADAGGVLREELTGKYEGDLCGLDDPTGRGYMLPTNSPEQVKPVALVEFRSVYGNEMIYPANEAARLFARMAKKITLNTDDLATMRLLGFSVQQSSSSKLAA